MRLDIIVTVDENIQEVFVSPGGMQDAAFALNIVILGHGEHNHPTNMREPFVTRGIVLVTGKFGKGFLNNRAAPQQHPQVAGQSPGDNHLQ